MIEKKMKLKFKKQAFQTEAVNAVADCFSGQPKHAGLKYRIDPGKAADVKKPRQRPLIIDFGFKNHELVLTPSQLLENIQSVQRQQNLHLSPALATTRICSINLDIEMETGTGKTYCYIKTMFELNERYGWSKYIVMVPSIAIREGMYKSFEITADHFMEQHYRRIRFFIYNSKQIHHLENFSSDGGINVMIINVQAFAARGKDARRIYAVLDEFQSRRPIDVIKSNHPILILDEPQKMEGAVTTKTPEEFNPLAVLRYSATHKTVHNKELKVTKLQYTIQRGEQRDSVTHGDLRSGAGFEVLESQTEHFSHSVHSGVKYDLIGKVAEDTKLTRATIAGILKEINESVFSQYRVNPEDFILKAATLINEQKATVIVEHLAYDMVEDRHNIDIFTTEKPRDDFSKAIKTDHHIYDYVFTDAKNERQFVIELDKSVEVVVYANLPHSFFIPTPVGDYNPDWAITFKEGTVKHIYFVAETKGSMSSMELRRIEECKIECARKFFAKITSEQVRYDVVDSYGKLMELVK